MARSSTIQTNFTLGELSPRLFARVDDVRYFQAAKKILNAVCVLQGGVERRPGSLFDKETKTSLKKSRLIPFVFSTTTAYVLEFGDLYMRVFKNGVQVEASPGVPFEITTPYTENDIASLNYAHSADTMFLAHPSFAMRRLVRLADNKWKMAVAPFVIEPNEELGFDPAASITLSATTGTITVTASVASFLASDVGRQITAGLGAANITVFTSTTVVTAEVKDDFESTGPITAGNWTITESPKTTCTPSDFKPIGKTITLTLGANGWRAGDVGKYVRINRGLVEITVFTSALVVSAIIRSRLEDTDPAEKGGWQLLEKIWNASNGFPGSVALYQQRLIANGGSRFPHHLYGTKTALFLDFSSSTLVDTDGFSFILSSEQINPIQHLVSAGDLLAFTYGGEFGLSGGPDTPLTPTSVQVTNPSTYGASPVRPVRVGQEILFIQRGGTKLLAFPLRLQGVLLAPDLTFHADHILTSMVKEAAYAQEPESRLWAVRKDGLIAVMSVYRNNSDLSQDIHAWSRQSTDGLYESICVVPIANQDQVWVIVNRTVGGATKRYVEHFDPLRNTDSCIVATSGTPQTVWSGLGHLEGKTVDILADGVVMPQSTVVSGSITLPRGALSVEIGLHYDSEIELLPLETNATGGTSQGNAVSVHEIVVRLQDTIGLTVGDEQVAFRQFGEDILDQPVDPFTGDKKVSALGWGEGGTVRLRQTQPLPFKVLGVVRRYSVND